jgi:hypothetical protein
VSTSTESGYALFARFAFPPNELGYCGPADTGALLGEHGADAHETHAQAFDGAWPYLNAIAESVDDDPLAEEVVRTYWVGGPLLDKVDPTALQHRLRSAFTGQVTSLLGALPDGQALAHHSFHVFVVYPWVGFLDRDPVTPLQVLQDCRIRWGTVEAVEDDRATIVSRPLSYPDGRLRLGDPAVECVTWRKGGTTLAPAPVPGETVAAHWDWLCGTLTESETAALAAATQATLDLVNDARS